MWYANAVQLLSICFHSTFFPILLALVSNKPIESAKGDIDAFEKAGEELKEIDYNLCSAEKVHSTFLNLTCTHVISAFLLL